MLLILEGLEGSNDYGNVDEWNGIDFDHKEIHGRQCHEMVPRNGLKMIAFWDSREWQLPNLVFLDWLEETAYRLSKNADHWNCGKQCMFVYRYNSLKHTVATLPDSLQLHIQCALHG